MKENKREHEDHQWTLPSAFRAWLKSERCGSDSQSRAIGTFSEVGGSSGVGWFRTWMKCQWGIGHKMGKNGGVQCGQNGWVGWEILQFSRGKRCCWFWCAKELNGFGLVERRAERSWQGWLLGNVGMIGMEAALSDQSKAGGSKVEAVVVVGAKSVSWAWASALTRRGGGLVWDEEVWCEGKA